MVFGTFDPAARYTERIAAYVVIRSANGDVAAVRGRSAYFLPGGGREGDETPEQTARREVREELGRDICITGRIGEATQYFWAASDSCHYKMQAVFFRAEFADSGDVPDDSRLHWLSAAEVPTAFFHACHQWAVEVTDAATDAAETLAGSARSRG